MTVKDGLSPKYADQDVRFRTTYYFRVFDYCYDLKTQTKLQPTTDSLYRFVMTGKANAYANRIRFESGTLKASQIDRFGATIERDDDTGRMRFVPQSEVDARARRNQERKEVRDLITLRQTFASLKAQPGGEQQETKDILKAIDEEIVDIIKNGLSADRVSREAAALSDQGGSPDASKACPAGTEIQRGFQIMGPQGVKTYNQDDRLIMAMSTYSKPLISALEQLSGRFLETKEQQTNSSEFLLALVNEQLRATDIDLIIATKKPDDSGSAFIEKIRTRLALGDDEASLTQPSGFSEDVAKQYEALVKPKEEETPAETSETGEGAEAPATESSETEETAADNAPAATGNTEASPE